MALIDQPLPAPRNRLLAALPHDVLAALWPRLERVELARCQILHTPGKQVSSIYFPETSWISMQANLEDGEATGIALIGREGFVGLPVLLGGDRDDFETSVQGPGIAFQMSACCFRKELEGLPALRTLLSGYALAQYSQIALTAACNARHQLSERLTRWLLMAHDRADSDAFSMTHELLSKLLGVRRAGVSVRAAEFAKAGFISYKRGVIQITDRPGLESNSCRCYWDSSASLRRLRTGQQTPEPSIHLMKLQSA